MIKSKNEYLAAKRRTQIGNAVPCRLAQVVASAVSEVILHTEGEK